MEAINSNSFFHYRSKKADFYKILRDGFSYRYSFEPLGEAFATANEKPKRSSASKSPINDEIRGVAIPMVCFCDIPIMRAGKHRKTYGDYCIGVDKEMMIERTPRLNPVFYVSSSEINEQFEKLIKLRKYFPEIPVENNPIVNAINSFSDSKELVKLVATNNGFSDELVEWVKKNNKYISKLIQKAPSRYNDISFELYNSLLHFIALCKHRSGKDYKGKDVCFYDEREWRVFRCQDELFPWEFDTTSKDFEPRRAAKNEELEEKGLFQEMITAEDVEKIISHIIVPKDRNIPTIIKEIMKSPTIFGHELPMEKKQLILSKVTSFERIEKDY